MRSGRYDGVERDYFFPRMMMKPPRRLGGFSDAEAAIGDSEQIGRKCR
jgi:hypothetical protein